MTTEPSQDRLYKIEYRIVYRDRNEKEHDVAFHEPGRMGFAAAETAQEMVEVLMKADQKLQESRTYEIQPILVSENYQKFDQNVIFHGMDEDDAEMAAMMDLIVPPQEPGPAQGGNSSN
jgi:hypothetical protein